MQQAVKLLGVSADEVQLAPEDAPTTSSSGWITCALPALLGIPLALKQLAPTTTETRPEFEQPAVFMLIDPATGFAPSWVQSNGLGEVLLARTDGKDLTAPDVWKLHEYHCHLVNRWSDWAESGLNSATTKEEQAAALSPAGYQEFLTTQNDNA